MSHKPDFVTELKNHLNVICSRMSAEQITDKQLCWEYKKYEIRKISVRFSKEKAKKTHTKIVTSENKEVSVIGTSLEKNLENFFLT